MQHLSCAARRAGSATNLLRKQGSSQRPATRVVLRNFASKADSTSCFLVDPRQLFGESDSQWADSSVQVDLTPELVAKLQAFDMATIKHQLATGEDPGNSWVFGEDGELFQLDFSGTLPTPSGYMCLLTPDTQSSSEIAAIHVADWPSMKESVDSASRKSAGHPVGGPFELPSTPAHPSDNGQRLRVTLAGQVLFAGGVDVYRKRSKKGSLATGVTLYGSESL